MAGNRCMTELSRCLQGHFASCSSSVAMFITRQLDEQEPPSPDHAHSVVKLLSQVGACTCRAYCPRYMYCVNT